MTVSIPAHRRMMLGAVICATLLSPWVSAQTTPQTPTPQPSTPGQPAPTSAPTDPAQSPPVERRDNRPRFGVQLGAGLATNQLFHLAAQMRFFDIGPASIAGRVSLETIAGPYRATIDALASFDQNSFIFYGGPGFGWDPKGFHLSLALGVEVPLASTLFFYGEGLYVLNFADNSLLAARIGVTVRF